MGYVISQNGSKIYEEDFARF